MAPTLAGHTLGSYFPFELFRCRCSDAAVDAAVAAAVDAAVDAAVAAYTEGSERPADREGAHETWHPH